uniref:Synaptobrevin, longin-like domain protein n=1 Tax=Tanacetum cinerariifolium TaxID=118510 RepID=A0A699GQQ0_TANCI|nr:synaptobrevin, longin-like domain protein [Tanacetum cinerariifolium]
MIYTSCIKEFWTSAKVKIVIDNVRLQALVDEKKVIVNEASIRRDLRLDNAEGTTCLPNDAIFEGLVRIGYEKPSEKLTFYKAFFSPQWKFLIHTILQCLSAKTTSWNEFSSTMASAIICLTNNQKFNFSKYILEDMIKNLETNQAAKIEKLKYRLKKLEGKKKKRTHGRIAEIDANEDLFVINETAQDQGRIKDQDLFGVHDLDGDVVFVEVTTSGDVEQDATVVESVKEPSEFRTTLPPQPSQPLQAKDKGKGMMVEPEKHLKKKDQITLDEEAARKLEAEMKAQIDEEERIAREKNEANRAIIKEWDDVRLQLMLIGRQELEQESAKKQKLVKQEQAKVADDDTVELKRCLEIVPKDDDDVAIKATPLSFKSPTIVDYKIYKEGKKSYFKIIRADGNLQNYLAFRIMFKNFNREDLEVLRSIVKERFKKTKPVDDMDNLLFQTLKTMFQPNFEDIIWKYQQGAVKVDNWKLFDSCGVYYVRLHVDYKVDTAYDLLRLISRQINEGYKPK